MKILGIETSCDETGVAVLTPPRDLLAQGLATQAALHAKFGGVVPELASRDHVAKLAPMVGEVMREAGLDLGDLTAIAYAAGPGLIGALMVGGAFATSLAYGLGIPAVPVHHMEAHLLACMLEETCPAFPFLALLVSGGHTQLVEVTALGRYRILGQTVDDAAGEAFDKVARLLGLPYPGGPALAALAETGDAERFAFPRPLRHQGLDFSFSGLKTAVRSALHALAPGGAVGERDRADVAASFQAAAVDTLVEKSVRGLESTGLERLVIAGGVGANKRLRQRVEAGCRAIGATAFFPRPTLCTDNGAMIAYAGWRRLDSGSPWPPRIVARPRWPLEELRPGGV